MRFGRGRRRGAEPAAPAAHPSSAEELLAHASPADRRIVEQSRRWSGRHVSEFFDELLEIDELRRLPMPELWRLLTATGYPQERFHLVKGMVEDTMPAHAPDRIALCRLDTDLYQSTAHEMEHLWPRLSPGGVLLVDDYGHFLGAKKAVDEYFERHGLKLLSHRADSTARVVVKPG